VFPSRNCTVPAALAGVTTAFSLAKSPSCVVVSLVVVSVGPTTTVTGDAVVDVLNAVEPDTGMNVAVSECDPAANVGVATAMPLLSAGVAITVAPSLNCTVPTAFAGLTVAVKVTAVPWATRVADGVSVVDVVVGAAASVTACSALPGGAELATPPMSNDAATTAAGTMQIPAVCQWKVLLLGMICFTSISDARWAKDSVAWSPASSASERARDQSSRRKRRRRCRQRRLLSRATTGAPSPTHPDTGTIMPWDRSVRWSP
jgi:hypothetical protein